MKTNNHTLTLLENGIHFSTLTNMSERQIKVLAERFKKEETNEVITTNNPDQALAMQKKDPTVNVNLTEKEMTEKFESKSQQGLFWSKCNNSKGKEKKKWCDMARDFSDDTTKKDYKKMPEKKHPEKTVEYKNIWKIE
jgi:hypothetical protein